MANVDPVTFQIVRHRLFSIVEEAVVALKSVSGTAITNEAHDLMVSLYRADGGLLACGLGFLHHLVPASWAVKHVLKEFSQDPGIFEDDVYLLNDPYTAALHAPDVYLIAPVHYGGRLVAFVADFVHVTDVGGIDPGGFCASATEVYHEGFRTRGLKLIERGRYRKDVLDTFLNMVRDPELTGLDIRSLVAACNVAKMRTQDLLAEYGAEVVDTACRELIEQSEALFRQRLRELPDGTWRARQYLDSKGGIARVNLAMTKRGDRLVFDFTGSDPQVPFGSNSTYCGTVGGCFAPLFPLLCYDIVWNDGVIAPVEVIAPEGSLVNCQPPAPVSIATTGVIQIVNNVSLICISKMLSASPAYRNEATAVWHGSHMGGGFFHGVNQYGRRSVFTGGPGGMSGSGGARAFKDGVELGGEIPNLVSRSSNAETAELLSPILWLYSRLLRDSGGPGKYRGGVSGEIAATLHDSSQVGFTAHNKGIHAPMSYGLCGGYPGCCGDLLLFRNTGLWEQEAELPYDLASTRGTPERIDWGAGEMHKGSIRYSCWMGGGGYGDPLDRDPQAVWQDVTLGLVSPLAAREVYGVALDAPGPDLEATRLLRESLRARRLQEVTLWEERYTLCPSCDGEVRKRAVGMKEGSLSRPGLLRSGDEPFVLREFFCARCATLVDTEVALRGDPVLHDELYG